MPLGSAKAGEIARRIPSPTLDSPEAMRLLVLGHRDAEEIGAIVVERIEVRMMNFATLRDRAMP